MNNPKPNHKPLRYFSPLHRATRSLQRHLEKGSRMGFVTVEGHLLSYLLGYGPCPTGDLVDLTGLKKSTLTGVLDRLEARGLLRREGNPDDRRSVLVSLAPAGRRAARKVRRVLDDFETALDAELTDADRRGFARTLAAIERLTQEEEA